MSRIGEKWKTNEGYWVTVIDYAGARNTTVQFEDSTIVSNVQYVCCKTGSIKNPHHPSVYGIGYIGVGKYVTQENNKDSKCYRTWNGMIERCYSEKMHLKRPTYKGCSVSEEWLNFQNFAAWFEENYVEGFELDKDLLRKGNKIYSSATCCFIPQEINKLLTKSNGSRGSLPIGVYKSGNKFAAHFNINKILKNLGSFNTHEEAFQAYKTAKEEHIVRVATIWANRLELYVYIALLQYQVEIND